MIDKYSYSIPCIDECHYILLKLVEQAVRDFISLEHSTSNTEKELYLTAKYFLFEDEYFIWWGGVEKSCSDILDVLDLNIDWFRERVQKAKKIKIKNFEIKRLLKNEY